MSAARLTNCFRAAIESCNGLDPGGSDLRTVVTLELFLLGAATILID